MILQRSIINSLIVFVFIFFPSIAFCQTHSLAILTPDNDENSQRVSRLLAADLTGKFKIIDSGLADSAFRSAGISEPFNQTIETAQTLASSIGCEYFLLIKARNDRRNAYQRPDYYESTAAIFVVNGRSGIFRDWKFYRYEAASAVDADKLFDSAIGAISNDIVASINAATDKNAADTHIAEPPDPAPVTFRAPIPYKRMKPKYTEQAAIYEIEATVDILVDVGADGSILGTDIVRWAGYGLDESVAENVRQMNWRPAEIDGKRLPMRILLRYNFKNVPTPEQ